MVTHGLQRTVLVGVTRALRPVILVMILVLARGAGAQGAPQTASELAAAAQRAYAGKEYRRAGELLEQLLERGGKNPSAAYDSARGYALAGDTDRAFAMLERALELGFHAADELTRDADLSGLRGDARWPRVLSRADAAARAFRAAHADPARAKIISTDVALFWNTYDKLAAAADPAALLDTAYLEAGTLGLQDFVPGRIQGGANLYAVIQQHPKYFAAIRDNTRRAAAVEPEVRQSFQRLKAIYPDATFPDVYFVIGAMSSGGTSTTNGLILGLEMFGRGPGVPVDEMNDWHLAVVSPYTVVPNIVAHELIHFQQRSDAKTLLARSFTEGAADFIASLISKGNFNAALYKYGYAHERELWPQFRAAMDGTDVTSWLYGGTPKNGRPADLGYFVGFRIAEAYYKRAKDKKQAVRDIILVDDPAKLLAASHYGDGFEQR